MAVARHAVGRILVPFAQQVGLSIVGTVVATLMITGIQHGSPAIPSAANAAPELTSGGKFAARAEAAADTSDGDAITFVSLPVMPLLRAASTPPTDTKAVPEAIAAADILSDRKPATDAVKPPRHAVRPDARRRQVADSGHDVVPPKRADYVSGQIATASDAGGLTPLQASDSGGLWISTKSTLAHIAGYGGAVWDRLIP